MKKINYERAINAHDNAINAIKESFADQDEATFYSYVAISRASFNRLLEALIEYEKVFAKKPSKKSRDRRSSNHKRRIRST